MRRVACARQGRALSAEGADGGAPLGNEECDDETGGVRAYGYTLVVQAIKELEMVGATGKFRAKSIGYDENNVRADEEEKVTTI